MSSWSIHRSVSSCRQCMTLCANKNVEATKAPTIDDKLKKCKLMLKAPTSDFIIVQGAYLYLSGMKAPISDDELKSCKKCWKRLLAMLEWSTWHMDMKLGLLSLSKHKANITELHPKVRPTCFIFERATNFVLLTLTLPQVNTWSRSDTVITMRVCAYLVYLSSVLRTSIVS